MPVCVCTQKEFLTVSKLNGFLGVLLLLLDFACCCFCGLLTGVCTCFFSYSFIMVAYDKNSVTLLSVKPFLKWRDLSVTVGDTIRKRSSYGQPNT